MAMVLCGLLGCTPETQTNAPPKQLSIDLHNESPSSSMRSQPAGEHSWTGRESDTVAVQMVAPVTARSEVTPMATIDGDLPKTISVFLDGAGQLGDSGTQLDSTLQFEEEVLPSTYDVLIAPEALQGRHAARFIAPVPFASDVPMDSPLDWSLPEVELVVGEVVRWNTNDPVPGAVITVYRATEPRLPAGVTTTTDSSGVFTFEVAEGNYDIVVTGPADGSMPIPPVRMLNQPLPLFPGLVLQTEVPVVPVIPVRGRLRRAGSDDTVPGRLRLSGQILDLLGGATGIVMGRYQVEIETESDGSFEIDLPLGSYEAVAIPRYLPGRFQSHGIGSRSFDVPFGVESVDGLDITMETPVVARIEAYNPGGGPMIGATLILRMRSAPRYAWRHVTGADGDLEGAFFGTLIPDEYDIELIPPPDADGKPRIARIQTRANFESDAVVAISARRSDRFQGLIFTEGQQPVGDVRVEVRDPETGKLWDTTVTRQEQTFRGVFEAVVPR